MTKVISLSVGLFCFLLACETWACRTINEPIEKRMKTSDNVYIGRVVGISVTELKRESENDDYTQESLIHRQRGLNKLVQFKIYDTLIGSERERIEVLINWCGGGSVEIGALGVLYGSGHEWHIKQGLSAVTASKNALIKGSK